MKAETTTLAIEQVSINALRPDPANPRHITAAELEALTRSISEFGLVDPILARREDGTVIGGHQRLLAARKLGLKTVPVIYLDLTLEKARLLNVGLNKISGDFDQELLARLLSDLAETPDVDLTLTGFDDKELTQLLKSLDAREKRDRPESFDLEAALEEARREPRVKPGEIWALGEHRLLCGDATRREDIERLMAGQTASMCFTDPPYNVSLGEHGGQQDGQKKRRLANDSLAPEAWEAFCRGWAGNLVSFVTGSLYICMSTKEWPTVSRVLEEAGAHWSDTII
ncbi:MAG: ParB N-terminal domain-containing protein [Gaiellales bacterium]|nr:ParB N-terminal domain-containing protein [Gaiellales bacterium]